jgi:Protein of unknown function (DUF2934)
MAPRRTSKTQPRRKEAPEPEAVAVSVATNGHSPISAAAHHNDALPSFEQIQRRAYEFYMARGGTHGCDWADWFAAEQELMVTPAAAH